VIVNVFSVILLYFVSAFYFILWAVVNAAYSALLSSSYFERINDDDDDDNDDERGEYGRRGEVRERKKEKSALWAIKRPKAAEPT